MNNNNQNDIFQTLSRLREKYPDTDDINRIESDGNRVKTLLAEKEYFSLSTTQELLEVCRKQILLAKIKLANDRSLIGDEKAQRELWFIIESRSWFVKMVSKDFDTELENIHAELLAQLDL